MLFAAQATVVLKKESTLAGDGWKIELNNHIAIFVKLLRECLRNLNHVSPELLSRLDVYTAKLAPAASDSGYDSASTSRDKEPSHTSLSISGSVSDMELVKTVANLFKVSESAIQREVDSLRHTCSEKAAMNDLKTCLKNINAGAPFPGRREDFDNEAAWQHWKTLEITHLQQMMLAMVQFNPELAKSAPSDVLPSFQNTPGGRPVSLYDSGSPTGRNPSIGSRQFLYTTNNYDDPAPGDDSDDDIQVGQNFTYIPPNPKRFYK
ncbi:hypothetical protein MPER_07703 [Moniliophthora perniciosa FA553]|nr:hypothetical protein MPER_07703 [Moniliophthora perniciosa FA553]